MPFSYVLLLNGPAKGAPIEVCGICEVRLFKSDVPIGLAAGLVEPLAELAVIVTMTSLVFMTLAVACWQVPPEAPVNGKGDPLVNELRG